MPKRNPSFNEVLSYLGVMGPEFATVTTAIDSSGYSVCKVSCLGKLTNEQFYRFTKGQPQYNI